VITENARSEGRVLPTAHLHFLQCHINLVKWPLKFSQDYNLAGARVYWGREMARQDCEDVKCANDSAVSFFATISPLSLLLASRRLPSLSLFEAVVSV